MGPSPNPLPHCLPCPRLSLPPAHPQWVLNGLLCNPALVIGEGQGPLPQCSQLPSCFRPDLRALAEAMFCGQAAPAALAVQRRMVPGLGRWVLRS